MLQKLSFALLFAVLTCGQIASAQISTSGECPKVEFMKEFDWPSYTGVWYEYSRYPTTMEPAQKCVYANYTALNDDAIGLKNSALSLFNRPAVVEANGKILGPGRMYVTFNGNGPKGTYIVLGTDYKSWAVVYSCQNVLDAHAELAWILTRERIPDKDTLTKAYEVFDKNGVSKRFLSNTEHNGCPERIELENKKINILDSLKKWILS